MNANLEAHNEMKTLIQGLRDRTSAAFDAKATAIVARLVEEWKLAGGCVKCNGTGVVLVWSTLDGVGYDEHGQCTDCFGKSVGGRNPCVQSPARSNGMHLMDNASVVMHFAKEEMAAETEAYEIAAENHQKTIGKRLDRGDYIIVVKGRKIPVGDHGVIVGLSNGQWGPKVGFIDCNGLVQWTAISNVERCLGMDGETKRPALEAWIKNDNAFRTSKGRPVVNHDIEKLMMDGW